MSPAFLVTMRSNAAAMKAGFEQLEAAPLYQSLPPRLRGAIYLVLDELVSNTVKFGGTDQAFIQVRLERHSDHCTLTIEDDAKPFNPLTAPPPVDSHEVEQIPIGGRGIHMVKQVVDSFEYSFHMGRNLVTLTFNTSRPPA